MRTFIGSIAFLTAFLTPVAGAAEQDLQARDWAATCTGCHGTNGKSEGAIPGIAGLDKAYIIGVLLEFKADKRPATVMHQHAKGYSDTQIERIAEFFASQKR
ncbi:MAG TPA: c-type cytochrome [Burkholderiales bacterium]|jgi:sulfide dehydrogenase cytochrome subunit|nr:c-type cytochrome [Burkholderiales bacterium]